MQSIVEKLIAENHSTRNPYLDLGRCGLTDLPKELPELQWLQFLNFGQKYLAEDDTWRETENAGENNELARADWGILQELPKLKGLFLDNCRLRSVPALENLPNLRLLRLENNEISRIRPLVKFCPDLEQLWLGSNRITDISSLEHLTSLWKLRLNSNSIEVIGSCSTLTGLTHLDLSGNKIVDISPLGESTPLVELKLDSNSVTDLSPLEKSARLKTLSMAFNELNSLDAVAGLKELVKLDLRGNRITDVTPLSGLKNLQELHLAGNSISDISSLIGGQALIVLDLSDNPISIIQPLTQLKNLERLLLSSNPIKDCPQDIWQTGDIRQIRSWFQSKKKAARPRVKQKTKAVRKSTRAATPVLHEVKLILVGNSGAGKTQLSRYLVDETYIDERRSTHGVRLERWRPQGALFENLLDKVAVNVWDFGGQEYYHGAYRLFLSNNAVYILLWESPTNVNDIRETAINDQQKVPLRHYHYNYWLENIRHYAPDSKILMVQNKIDLEGGKQRVAAEAFSDYNITEDHYISLKAAAKGDVRHRRSFEMFCSDLADCLNEAANLKNPTDWIRIRESLRDMIKGSAKKGNPFVQAAQNQKWILRKNFEAACKKINPKLTPDEVYTLPRWLHNCGLVIYFGDIPLLRERIFFDPVWVTQNIYDILNETVLENDGEFTAQQVEATKSKLAPTLLALMQEMEIIFERRDQPGTYVAPQYLPTRHPVEDLFAIAAGGLHRTAFNVRLPLYFFRKVMLKVLYNFGSSDTITAKYYWRNGILFEKLNTRVLVKGLSPEAGNASGVIVIGAEPKGGYKERQREVFQHILSVLQGEEWQNPAGPENGESFPSSFTEGWTKDYRNDGSNGEGKVRPRWLNALEISADGRHFVNYLDCCFAGQDGELSIKANDGEKLQLRDFEPLLDQTQIQPRRVFLSYSHTDSNLLNRLRMHLSPLRRMKNIESWSDQVLLPGDPWDEVIKENLNKADIIILLLTADFIASDYIWEVELREALKKWLAEEVRLIPILLQPLDYGALRLDAQLTKLLDTEMLPKDDSQQLIPVTLWDNQEEAFAKIAQRVREAIDKG
jgi:Leucine-rich repeat (LRR) protein/GTPase SAR1 family protein